MRRVEGNNLSGNEKQHNTQHTLLFCHIFAMYEGLYFLAHSLSERIHDINLEALDGKTVSEVYVTIITLT